jgi:L-fucono-1,5-lactonase
VIDAHHHAWRIGEHGCTWPGPDLPAIHHDFEIDALESIARPLGIAGSVLVQSQPDDRDTEWLLAIAAHTPFVKGVVGWVDLARADAPARIAALSREPKLRALRPMLQSLPQDDWICHPALTPAIAAMTENGLRFDALVYTRHLPHLRKFAELHPRLSIVIDHGAKPPVSRGEIKEWSGEIGALARLPNVACKLSGLLTEMRRDQPRPALRPYIDHLMQAFGPERLMWGSDWPVLNLAGDYGEWLGLAAEFCGLSAERDRAQLFGGTARAFYGLADA